MYCLFVNGSYTIVTSRVFRCQVWGARCKMHCFLLMVQTGCMVLTAQVSERFRFGPAGPWTLEEARG